MFLKKAMPSLYEALGVYLPLITTNCAVLGVVLQNTQNGYGFIESVVYGVTGGIGFLLVIVIFASIRERMEFSEWPFIAANNEKTTQEAMAAVLPANSYDEVEYTGGDAMVQAVYKAGDAGYVVEVKPATSFSGNLTIMVGVDNTGACSGISITSTGETSGLGSNASKPDFQAQFVGKTGELSLIHI